ncbi:uncharacterized protein LOC130654968 isoform X2 [Hydractinia symbiolongicarpus]|uniref:uncharacterized protein LOC130654968 isoform X2 n=1 Tax=Hydractinia symbiolongicarpus TaxID=13093 RepID=UPI0025503619|nr:uncharacterized protein LOC130654968 isoform X2 [Hydractinia symbiolongicarpus]
MKRKRKFRFLLLIYVCVLLKEVSSFTTNNFKRHDVSQREIADTYSDTRNNDMKKRTLHNDGHTEIIDIHTSNHNKLLQLNTYNHINKKSNIRQTSSNHKTRKRDKVPIQPDKIDVNTGQKRANLRESELTFTANSHLHSDILKSQKTAKDKIEKDATEKSSNEKEIEKETEEEAKDYYGSKSRPAKSCRDLFLTNRNTPSGNYWIKTADDELLMVTCGFPSRHEEAGELLSKENEENETKGKDPDQLQGGTWPFGNAQKDMPEMAKFLETNNISIPTIPQNTNSVKEEKNQSEKTNQKLKPTANAKIADSTPMEKEKGKAEQNFPPKVPLVNPAPNTRPTGPSNSMRKEQPTPNPTRGSKNTVQKENKANVLPYATLVPKPPPPTEPMTRRPKRTTTQRTTPRQTTPFRTTHLRTSPNKMRPTLLPYRQTPTRKITPTRRKTTIKVKTTVVPTRLPLLKTSIPPTLHKVTPTRPSTKHQVKPETLEEFEESSAKKLVESKKPADPKSQGETKPPSKENLPLPGEIAFSSGNKQQSGIVQTSLPTKQEVTLMSPEQRHSAQKVTTSVQQNQETKTVAGSPSSSEVAMPPPELPPPPERSSKNAPFVLVNGASSDPKEDASHIQKVQKAIEYNALSGDNQVIPSSSASGQPNTQTQKIIPQVALPEQNTILAAAPVVAVSSSKPISVKGSTSSSPDTITQTIIPEEKISSSAAKQENLAQISPPLPLAASAKPLGQPETNPVKVEKVSLQKSEPVALTISPRPDGTVQVIPQVAAQPALTADQLNSVTMESADPPKSSVKEEYSPLKSVSDNSNAVTAPVKGIPANAANSEVDNSVKMQIQGATKSFSKVKNLGVAGDLGDLQEERPSVEVNQNSMDTDELFGRRKVPRLTPNKEDLNPELAITKDYKTAMEFETQAQVRSWSNKDEKMMAKHVFNDQYKSFDPSEKDLKAKKPSIENAHARSWANNQIEMKNKQIQNQYDNFEKTEKEIKEEERKNQYTKQYNDFEKPDNETSSNNTSNESQADDKQQNDGDKKEEEHKESKKQTEDDKEKKKETADDKEKKKETADDKEKKKVTADDKENRKETTKEEEGKNKQEDNKTKNDESRNKEEKVANENKQKEDSKPEDGQDDYANYLNRIDNDPAKKSKNETEARNETSSQVSYPTPIPTNSSTPYNNHTNDLIKVSDGSPTMYTNAPLGTSVSNATTLKQIDGQTVPVEEANATVALTARKREKGYEKPFKRKIDPNEILTNPKPQESYTGSRKNIVYDNDNDDALSSFFWKHSDEENKFKHQLKQISGPPNHSTREYILPGTYPGLINQGMKNDNNEDPTADNTNKKHNIHEQSDESKYDLYSRLHRKKTMVHKEAHGVQKDGGTDDDDGKPSNIYVDNRVFIYGNVKGDGDEPPTVDQTMSKNDKDGVEKIERKLKFDGGSPKNAENGLSETNILSRSGSSKSRIYEADETKMLPSYMRPNIGLHKPLQEVQTFDKKYKLNDLLKGANISVENHVHSTGTLKTLVSASPDENDEENNFKNSKHPLKTVPNPYNFIVPETRKFSMNGETPDRVQDNKKYEAYFKNEKKKEIEHKKMISFIRAQALSKAEATLGKFTTSRLKQFAYKPSPHLDSVAFVREIDPNGHGIQSDKDSSRSFLKTKGGYKKHGPISFVQENDGAEVKMSKPEKNLYTSLINQENLPGADSGLFTAKWNVQDINKPLYNIGTNMQDLVTSAQHNMQGIPGYDQKARDEEERAKQQKNRPAPPNVQQQIPQTKKRHKKKINDEELPGMFKRWQITTAPMFGRQRYADTSFEDGVDDKDNSHEWKHYSIRKRTNLPTNKRSMIAQNRRHNHRHRHDSRHYLKQTLQHHSSHRERRSINKRQTVIATKIYDSTKHHASKEHNKTGTNYHHYKIWGANSTNFTPKFKKHFPAYEIGSRRNQLLKSFHRHHHDRHRKHGVPTSSYLTQSKAAPTKLEYISQEIKELNPAKREFSHMSQQKLQEYKKEMSDVTKDIVEAIKRLDIESLEPLNVKNIDKFDVKNHTLNVVHNVKQIKKHSSPETQSLKQSKIQPAIETGKVGNVKIKDSSHMIAHDVKQVYHNKSKDIAITHKRSDKTLSSIKPLVHNIEQFALEDINSLTSRRNEKPVHREQTKRKSFQTPTKKLSKKVGTLRQSSNVKRFNKNGKQQFRETQQHINSNKKLYKKKTSQTGLVHVRQDIQETPILHFGDVSAFNKSRNNTLTVNHNVQAKNQNTTEKINLTSAKLENQTKVTNASDRTNATTPTTNETSNKDTTVLTFHNIDKMHTIKNDTLTVVQNVHPLHANKSENKNTVMKNFTSPGGRKTKIYQLSHDEARQNISDVEKLNDSNQDNVTISTSNIDRHEIDNNTLTTVQNDSNQDNVTITTSNVNRHEIDNNTLTIVQNVHPLLQDRVENAANADSSPDPEVLLSDDNGETPQVAINETKVPVHIDNVDHINLSDNNTLTAIRNAKLKTFGEEDRLKQDAENDSIKDAASGLDGKHHIRQNIHGSSQDSTVTAVNDTHQNTTDRTNDTLGTVLENGTDVEDNNSGTNNITKDNSTFVRPTVNTNHKVADKTNVDNASVITVNNVHQFDVNKNDTMTIIHNVKPLHDHNSTRANQSRVADIIRKELLLHYNRKKHHIHPLNDIEHLNKSARNTIQERKKHPVTADVKASPLVTASKNSLSKKGLNASSEMKNNSLPLEVKNVHHHFIDVNNTLSITQNVKKLPQQNKTGNSKKSTTEFSSVLQDLKSLLFNGIFPEPLTGKTTRDHQAGKKHDVVLFGSRGRNFRNNVLLSNNTLVKAEKTEWTPKKTNVPNYEQLYHEFELLRKRRSTKKQRGKGRKKKQVQSILERRNICKSVWKLLNELEPLKKRASVAKLHRAIKRYKTDCVTLSDVKSFRVTKDANGSDILNIVQNVKKITPQKHQTKSTEGVVRDLIPSQIGQLQPSNIKPLPPVGHDPTEDEPVHYDPNAEENRQPQKPAAPSQAQVSSSPPPQPLASPPAKQQEAAQPPQPPQPKQPAASPQAQVSSPPLPQPPAPPPAKQQETAHVPPLAPLQPPQPVAPPLLQPPAPPPAKQQEPPQPQEHPTQDQIAKGGEEKPKQQKSTEESMQTDEDDNQKTDDNGPPVEADGKPHADSGPQPEKVEENSANVPTERPNVNETAPDVGESGKNEVRTNSHGLSNSKHPKKGNGNQDESKLKKEGKSVDTTFEAGLQEEEKNKASGNLPDDSNESEHTVNSKPIKDSDGNIDLGAQQLEHGSKATKQTKNEQNAANLSGMANLTTYNQAINISAFETAIMELLNRTAPRAKPTKSEKEAMENLMNKKYPELKLPQKNGDYVPPSAEDEMNEKSEPPPKPVTTKAKPHLRPPLPPIQEPEKSESDKDEDLTRIVDSTPTESAYADDKPTPPPQPSPPPHPPPPPPPTPTAENEGNNNAADNSELVDTTSKDKPNVIIQIGQQQDPVKLKEGNKDAEQEESQQDKVEPISHAQEKTESTSQTQDKAETTSQAQDDQASGINRVAVNTEGKNQAIPLIPIPQESPLGKLLYPALEPPSPDSNGSPPPSEANASVSPANENSKNAATTNANVIRLSPSLNGKFTPNVTTTTSSDGYTQIVIDQTKQLLRQNKINREDLLKILQVSRNGNTRFQIPTYKINKNVKINKKQSDKSLTRSNVDHVTVDKKAQEIMNSNMQGSIHISLLNRNGQVVLVPNEKEAYERKLIPQIRNLTDIKYAFKDPLQKKQT